MGLCASNEAEESQQQRQQQQQGGVQPQPKANGAAQAQGAAPKAAPSPTSAGGTTNGAALDDNEYRNQLNTITLYLLDKLIQVMELEREGMSALAVLRAGKGASYLQLFGADMVELFLRSTFDVSAVESVSPQASPLEQEQAFASLLRAAQADAERNPHGAARSPSAQLSRQAFTQQLQQMCQAVQAELRQSAAALEPHRASLARSDELAKQIAFFVQLFDFTRGDIAADSRLLDANVEAIISASST